MFFFSFVNGQNYTEQGATFPSTELIGRVLFGETPWGVDDILNPSEFGITNSFCTGYSNFTIGNNNNSDGNNLDLEFYRYVSRGETYEIEIVGTSCSNSLTPSNRGVKVFIDFNDDGDFDDLDELVWTSPTVLSTTPVFTSSITIPNDAELGVLRMRVIYARILPGLQQYLWNGTNSLYTWNAELTSYTHGETEDYNLIVIGLIDSVIITDESCPGLMDGTLTVIPELTAPQNLEYSITSSLGPWTTDPYFPNLTPGNYTVWAIDPLTGDMESENFIINSANSCFDIDAGSDIISCEGLEVQINAENVLNASYSWSPSFGMNDPTIPNPIISPTTTTTYTLQVDSAGQIATDNVTVYVYPNPVFNVSLDQNICSGEVPSNIIASYISGATYTWNPTTALSNPNNNQTSFNSNITTTTYVVSVDLSGCVAEDSITINVSPVPTVTLSASPSEVCLGDEVTLLANTESWVNYFHFQLYNGTSWVNIIQPGMNTVNPIVSPPLFQTTNFRVRVAEDWPGCTPSNFDFITVPVIDINPPPIIHN